MPARPPLTQPALPLEFRTSLIQQAGERTSQMHVASVLSVLVDEAMRNNDNAICMSIERSLALPCVHPWFQVTGVQAYLGSGLIGACKLSDCPESQNKPT